MNEFLLKEFYWNTVSEWLIALGIIIASVLVGRLVFWVMANVVSRITAKTETNLDDIIIDMVEEPLSFALTILGIWYGINSLHMPDVVHVWLNRIYYLLIIFNVAWLVNRLIDALMKEYVQPLAEKSDTNLDDQLLPILKKGMHFAVWAIALVVGLNNAGYDVGALIAGLGIGGLAFALAAQDTVSNLFGGITVFVDKPFKIKDRIKVNGLDGFVEDMGIRTTKLRTMDGRLVTVPNKTFSQSPIENVTSEPSRKVTLNLGLTYATTPAQMTRAIEVLREIGTSNTGVEEAMDISFATFTESALTLQFVYFIRKEGGHLVNTPNEVNLAILERFKAEGFQFAYPTRTVHMVN